MYEKKHYFRFFNPKNVYNTIAPKNPKCAASSYLFDSLKCWKTVEINATMKGLLFHILLVLSPICKVQSLYTLRSLYGKDKKRYVYHLNTFASLSQRSLKWIKTFCRLSAESLAIFLNYCEFWHFNLWFLTWDFFCGEPNFNCTAFKM